MVEEPARPSCRRVALCTEPVTAISPDRLT